MNVIVAQKGSREHYLVARALQRRGHLAQLITDWYPPCGALGRALSARHRPRWLARAVAPCTPELPAAAIRAWRLQGLRYRLAQARAARSGAHVEAMLAADIDFASRVAAARLPPHDVFFGYAYASLEAIRAESARGVRTIVDQIDPGYPEYRLVEAESRAWPDYARPALPPPPAYYARARDEWQAADVIVVNSEWTREQIREDGAPDARIAVLPLAYEPSSPPAVEPRPPARDTLIVLWLGTVCLRKGIPYLVDAARRLTDARVEIRVAGALEINRSVLRDAPSNMRWLGPVPKTEAAALYRDADVFVLPTISDGFALTQLEALAHGLPVIVTPHCARVVEDGRTGIVIPPRDAEALAAGIRRFADDRALAPAMAPACRAAASAYSIDRYAAALEKLLA